MKKIDLTQITVNAALAKKDKELFTAAAKNQFYEMMTEYLADAIIKKAAAIKKETDENKLKVLQDELEALDDTMSEAERFYEVTQADFDAFTEKVGNTTGVICLLRLSVMRSNKMIVPYIIPAKVTDPDACEMVKALLAIHDTGKADDEGGNTSTAQEYAAARRALVKYYSPYFSYTDNNEYMKKIRVKAAAKADDIPGVDGSFMFAVHETFIRNVKTTDKGLKFDYAFKIDRKKVQDTIDNQIKYLKGEIPDLYTIDLTRLNAVVCELLYKVITLQAEKDAGKD